MSLRWPQPGDEYAFQQFCVRLYREQLQRAGLHQYAKRGQAQHGIDIVDLHQKEPRYVIQCKHKEPQKKLDIQDDIRAEVAAAEKSDHEIDIFILATTACKDGKAQDEVMRLNARPETEKQFDVELHYWEEINELLNAFGTLKAWLIVEGKRPQEIDAAFGASSNASKNVVVFDGDTYYPEIAALFEARKIEAAEHEVEQLPDPEGSNDLSEDERYGLLAIRAKLALEKQGYREAARLYCLAYGVKPDRRQARHNYAVALELQDDHEGAYRVAEEAYSDGDRSAGILTLLVRNAAVPEKLDVYRDEIAETQQTSEELNVALARQSLQWDDIDRAANAAALAISIAPSSAHALYANGMLAHNRVCSGSWRERDSNIALALEHYSSAINAARKDKYFGLVPDVLCNRARIHAVAGNEEAAIADVLEMVSVADNNPRFAYAAVEYFVHIRDFETSLSLVPYLDSDPDAQVLRTVTEYNLASDKDERERHIDHICELANTSSDRATEARCFAVEWLLLDSKSPARAREVVTKGFQESHPLIAHTLLGWVEVESDAIESARREVLAALEHGLDGVDDEELDSLVRLLLRLEEHAHALPIIERLATPGVLNKRCRLYIACADRAGRDDILLRVCDELRVSGSADIATAKLEVRLLVTYAPERVSEAAASYRSLDPVYFDWAKNLAAVRLDKLTDQLIDDSAVPSVESFDTHEPHLVVTPYVDRARYAEALDFLYERLRHYPSSEVVHGQYIWFVLQYGRKAGVETTSREVVDEACAVQLEDTITGATRWIVLEHHRPENANGELSPTAPLVAEVLGARKGDVVDVQGPRIQPQSERITEIQSKYLWRFRETLEHYPTRFPEGTAMQPVHVGSGDDFDPSTIIEVTRAKQDRSEAALEVYRNQPIPHQLLAEHLGIDLHQAIACLADSPDEQVRCVELTIHDFSEAVDLAAQADTFVLDLTAVVTISRLGAWEALPATRAYLVAQSAFDAVGVWEHQLTQVETQPAGHTSVSENGRLVLTEVTADQREAEIGFVSGMYTALKERCQIESATSISEIPHSRRSDYEAALGGHGLESLCLSREKSCPIWLDDLFVGISAVAEFGVLRLWTQAVFCGFKTAGELGADAYSEAVAQLLAWDYTQTRWEAADLVAAGKVFEWNPQDSRLARVLKLLSGEKIRLAQKAVLLIEFMRLLRASSCPELQQTSMVQAALKALDNAVVVRVVRSKIDGVFGPDIETAKFMKLQLDYWGSTALSSA